MEKKILVVDDEQPIRDLLAHKLSTQGFHVITAKDEREFFVKALEECPDLIVLDIWLKNKIGTESYQNLLNFGFNPDIPVIFITALMKGYPKDTPAAAGRKYALYSKPFDFEKLLDEVHSLLNEESNAVSS